MEQLLQGTETPGTRETEEGRDRGRRESWPQVVIRPATLEDLPYLEHRVRLKPRNEQVQLGRAIVFVAEYDGCIVGFTAARIMWQVEPLMLFDEFRRHAPKHARARATLQLIRAIDGWIADRDRNITGIHSYFCFITGRVMQRLAISFGMLRVYTGGKFFGRDT